jgi:hypothetical protein
MESKAELTTIYKRFWYPKALCLSNMNGIQWFSFESDYGKDVYGPIVHTYYVIDQPRLIDLGKMKTRMRIVSDLDGVVADIADLMDPDEQYSGGRANMKVHQVLKQLYGKQFDGTIIKEVDHEDLEGPEEIVLWTKPFTQFLKKV